jgi:hypothetical protein
LPSVDAHTGIDIEDAMGAVRGNRITGSEWAIAVKDGATPSVVENVISDDQPVMVVGA